MKGFSVSGVCWRSGWVPGVLLALVFVCVDGVWVAYVRHGICSFSWMLVVVLASV
jgi:predicted outer membrane lipoprotein